MHLKELEQIEDDQISSHYSTQYDPVDSGKTFRVWSYDDMLRLLVDEAEGKIARPNKNQLEKYLLGLPIETLADLTLLMYLGRDRTADMDTEPFEDRFLHYFDEYSYIVLGIGAENLAEKLMGKKNLSLYLKNGIAILSAPKGTNLDDLFLYS